MKKKYVQEGVFLVCDKGTTISRLKNLHYQEITLFNNTFATRKDKKLFVNFDMFGSCSTCNGCPCTAPVTDWTNITDGITIDGNELLLENSELPCAKGGNIKIFYTKQSATNALPKKKKSFWDFLSDGAKTSFSFTKGFYKGLWKGLKGTVTSIVDLVVWADKHQTIYALANPVEYDKLLQKDAEMMKKLGKLAKKGSIWLYRNSKINLYNNPTDYFLAQTENAQMMDKLLDKVSKMSAEESGDFTGQLGFEIILELGTGGGAFALSAIKVADKGLDVVKAVERLGDVSDALKTAEKLEDISDGIKTMENLNDTKPLKIGEVTHEIEHIFDFKQYQLKKGQKLGTFGEEVVEEMLKKDGYERFYKVQNNSGNGVDIVAKKSNGDILKAEVKSTQQERYWNKGNPKEIPLRGEQKTMGGEKYTNDRLNRAANGDDGYTDGKSTEEAEKALDNIREAKANGNVIKNKKYDVYVDKKGNLRSNPIEREWKKP